MAKTNTTTDHAAADPAPENTTTTPMQDVGNGVAAPSPSIVKVEILCHGTTIDGLIFARGAVAYCTSAQAKTLADAGLARIVGV